MKRWNVPVAAALLLLAGVAAARDTVHHLPVDAVLSHPNYSLVLGDDIAFYFGDAPAPAGTDLGSFVTNKKTNAFNKTDEEACQWVMLSALIQLRDRARDLDADAVVNVRSYYKRATFTSQTEYECHAGAVMAGVALKAAFIKTR